MLTKGLQASSCRSFHWRNAAENRPQAKGVERACGILKEGIFSNWLGLERHLHARVALESPLMGFLVGHAYRTYNCFNNRSGSSPLERMRESRGGQCPRSFCFGALGYGKPVNPNVWPGRRIVYGCYLGMRFITGGGCLLFPADADANGVREVIRCHSFRVKEVVNINEAFDADLLFPLLAGVMPEVVTSQTWQESLRHSKMHQDQWKMFFHQLGMLNQHLDQLHHHFHNPRELHRERNQFQAGHLHHRWSQMTVEQPTWTLSRLTTRTLMQTFP